MKKVKQILSLFLCISVLISGFIPVYAEASQKATKDENVFLILNADGSIQDQIVSNWIHCDSGVSHIKDQSSLSNIENLKGEQLPEKDNGFLIWNTEETDVYYQGKTQQTPPITISIQYELDGKNLSASELIGKSGHVKISVKLTNHEKTTQEINGKQRDIYTPFITVVSANFPTENFKNIIAAQGTVQTDSANQLACFITIPGMAQTFDGLLTGQLDQINEYLRDEVIVEADTDCFQMPSFMIASATSMEQLKKKNDIPDLSKSFDKLNDATDELKNGTQQLSDATTTLDSKMQEFLDSYCSFDDGIGEALDGAKQLEDGTDVLSSGAKDLYEGTVRLQTGSNKLAESLNSRFVPGLQAASDKQAALESSMTAIGKQIETLSLPDIEQLKNSLSEGIGTIVDQVSYHSAQAAVEQTASLCQDAISDLSSNAQLLALLKGYGLADDEAKQILETVLSSADQVVGAVAQSSDTVASAIQNSSEIQSAKQQAITSVISPLSSLDLSVLGSLLGEFNILSGNAQSMMEDMSVLTRSLYNSDNPSDPTTVVGAVNAISQGSNSVSEGARQLQSGASRLSSGASDLSSGLSKLVSASRDIQNAITQFKSGTSNLSDGAQTLNSGFATFLTEGIEKMTGSIDTENLSAISQISDKLEEQVNSYNSYSGSAEGVRSSVKFVMKVTAPHSNEPKEPTSQSNQQKADPEQLSLWQRFVNLFRKDK